MCGSSMNDADSKSSKHKSVCWWEVGVKVGARAEKEAFFLCAKGKKGGKEGEDERG